MPPSDITPLLELDTLSKSFPGVQALDRVSMDVRPGEVHALVGENGAGKSTLLKILFGVYQPDEGTVRIQGQPVEIDDPKSASRHGIAMIHQELQQVPELDAAQNIFLGQPLTRFGIFNDRARMRKIAHDLLARLDVDIDVTTPVKKLSIAQRQLIEIARALWGNARIIAMDEPTSSLTPTEFRVLFRIINELKADGVGIIYVSHRLGEIFQLADRATILRDGERVAVVDVADVDEADIVSMMVGRATTHSHKHITHTRSSERVLRVSSLSWGDRVKSVSFDLYRGEILGVAGLIGSGRTELMQLIAGLHRPTSGSIELNGEMVEFGSPRHAIRAGIGMLPEDRKREGIVPLRSVLANTSLPVIGEYSSAGLIRDQQRREAVNGVVDKVNLRPRNIDRPIRYFSGGNQQKAILARWLNADSEIFIFDEPTRGIDVGAKQEIYTLMEALAAQGKAILMVSSELPEVLRLSDRVLVMRTGEARAILDRDEMDEETIMRYAIVDRQASMDATGSD